MLRRTGFGAVTVLPAVSYIAWLTGLFNRVADSASGAAAAVLLAVILALALLTTILVIVFITEALGNEHLTRAQRRRWSIAHFLFAPVTIPMYWWRYLRPTSTPAPA
jgi:hypothetical protein